MRASNAEEVESHVSGDPWEIFTQLVLLIVEGRTPGGEKGYHAGPHCILPHQSSGHRHACDLNVPVCLRAESLMKQLKLMWGVGVGVSVEVLLAPECQHGAAITTAPDTTSAPSPYLKLIEQWNFSVFDRKLPQATSSGWALVAAVRSFLHFSQLSAWLSVSGGSRPPNILYRLTVSSPVFSSKFDSEPEEHIFPLANLGQDTSIKVVVRAQPRNSQVPVLLCPQHSNTKLPVCETPPSTTFNTAPHPTLLQELCDVQAPSSSQNSSLTSLTKSEANRSEEDLRRSMMKTRLTDGSRVTRSESPDTQLGESLLDPPNSLSRIPRRFQSPSRSGSPSLETPEHLICRVRQPGPSHARPPDAQNFPCRPIVVPARQPLNPFPWTRTRYPNLEHSYSVAFSSTSHNNYPEFFHGNYPPQSAMPLPHKSAFSEASNAALTCPLPNEFGRSNASQPSLIQNQQQRLPEKPPYTWSHHPGISSEPDTSPLIAQPSSPHKYVLQNESIPITYSHPTPQVLNKDTHEPPLVNRQQYSSTQSAEAYTPDASVGCSKDTSTCLVMPHSPSINHDNFNTYGGHSDSYQQLGHGKKRKGAHSSESPRVKRESPPRSVSISDVEMESEYKKAFQESTSENSSHPRQKDHLWPSCSQSRKHLCSNVEDLPEVCITNKQDEFAKSKLMKQDAATSSFLKSPPGKFKFDLTPKETREILYVLRQSTPVPPLRIDQHRSSMMPHACISRKSPGKRNTGAEETSETFCCTQQNVQDLLSNKIQKLEADQRTTATTAIKNIRPQKMKWCHNCSPGDTSMHLDIRGDLPCSNKPCDNSCKKQFNSSILTKKTLEKSDSLMISQEDLDQEVTDDNDNGGEIEDGLSSMEIENMKNSPSTSSGCIEAQKVTQRTNFFTASSQPAGKSKDIPKQVSQNLVKSPLRSVLSSIESVSLHSKDQSRSPFEGNKPARLSRVNRSLSFDSTVCKPENKLKIPNEPCIKECPEPPTTSSTDRPTKWEPREGFVKSTSLFKVLFKSSAEIEGNLIQKCTESQLEEKLPATVSQNVSCDPNDNALENGCDDIKNKQSTNIESTLPITSAEVKDYTDEDQEVEDCLQVRGIPIPTTSDKVNFRRSLDSATTLVFHKKTGLPLTSSPAPMRKGKRFDFDSSLNSVAAIGSALRTCEDEEEVNENCLREPSSLEKYVKMTISISAPTTVTCSNLLGSFEECVLNGRLEPVSTVHGFMAEIAASGAFIPRHITKPVTVFFYTLCDNDQISSPYMGHINLGKKGYHIPSQGTVQVTLFNPHRTVVKMFVVVYDLSDMPPNSKTFLRQRTLNMPVGASDSHPDAHQWLRYLIHLRFASSKSGKIYLHTDIRMLIFRKSDADAATLHKTNLPYELRSFTNGPSNPKFSPRK